MLPNLPSLVPYRLSFNYSLYRIRYILGFLLPVASVLTSLFSPFLTIPHQVCSSTLKDISQTTRRSLTCVKFRYILTKKKSPGKIPCPPATYTLQPTGDIYFSKKVTKAQFVTKIWLEEFVEPFLSNSTKLC